MKKSFKELRKLQKVKQKDIVKQLKVSAACVSQWETGKRTPNIKQLPLIAGILKCSLEDLILALIETEKGEIVT